MMAWSGGLALLWIGGCASQNYARPSSKQITDATSAVWKARARGAGADGRAAPFLSAAERQLYAARHSLDAGKNRDANWLLARATVDGQLAEALVRRSGAEREVARTESRLTEVRAATRPAPASQPGPE
jgi:hypothetical protein